jgi:uncharacterized protein YjbJ (UPF0337 family)
VARRNAKDVSTFSWLGLSPRLLSKIPVAQEVTTETLAGTSQTQKRENRMSESTKIELKGMAHEAKGAFKAATGKVTSNPKLEAEGHVEKAGGKVQRKIGEIEKVIDK